MLNMKKRGFIFIVVVSMILSSLSMIHGFGIVSSYYPGNPLIMAPGERQEVQFGRLQNMLENSEDLNVSIQIISGSEIAQAIRSEYIVQRKTENIPINIKLSIPQDAPEGIEYTITIKFKETDASNEEEIVGFSKTTTQSIPVLVKRPLRPDKPEGEISSEKTKKANFFEKINWILWGSIFIFVTCIILLLAIKLSNSKKINPSEMLK
jgi:hypothetical protein